MIGTYWRNESRDRTALVIGAREDAVTCLINEADKPLWRYAIKGHVPSIAYVYTLPRSFFEANYAPLL